MWISVEPCLPLARRVHHSVMFMLHHTCRCVRLRSCWSSAAVSGEPSWISFDMGGGSLMDGVQFLIPDNITREPSPHNHDWFLTGKQTVLVVSVGWLWPSLVLVGVVVIIEA